jgi:two-component system, NtrC family, response regulator AtoC
MITILVAEDELEVRDYLGLALNCAGYKVEFAGNGDEVLSQLQQRGRSISLLLLDLIMPEKDGLQTLREVRQAWPRLPVITVSGCCNPAQVASAMKGGAIDFLSKPVGHEQLLGAVRLALATTCRNEDETETVATRIWNSGTLGIGAWSRKIDSLLASVGASDAPVLLRGETGVGKEVLARALHERSKRARGPFLKLNCAALPSELIESELFGYEKGAFTGACKTTPGKFAMADRGTILLDEIGDMDFKLQAKLLQVLQDREFLRLGAKETSRVDVRIMAATHCDLERAIATRHFREDLYYRLNILEIHVPPLRERKEEIVGLAECFLKKYAPLEPPEIPQQLKDVLLDHNWPGNVRELENVIRKFLVFRSVEVIASELKCRQEKGCFCTVAPLATHEGSVPTTAKSRTNAILTELNEARKQSEIDAIVEVLNSTLWNRKQAAKVLNIQYKALLYKMKKLGIGESPVLARQPAFRIAENAGSNLNGLDRLT